MKNIFNISSAGGTGTGWVAALLNSHPKIVCLHALRNKPFRSDNTHWNAEGYFTCLMELRDQTANRKTFGTIHSFYGAEAKPHVIDAGGSHKYMIRKPFTRLHSLFTHHYRDILGYSIDAGQDVYSLAIDRGHIKESSQPIFQETTEVEAQFLMLCNHVILSDWGNMDEGTEEDCIKHEQFFSDQEYALHHLSELIGGEKEFLNEALSARMPMKINTHTASVPLSDHAIFDLWPERFRRLFISQLTQNDSGVEALLAAYERKVYVFPESFYKWSSSL